MKKIFFFLLLLLAFFSCRKRYEAPVPDLAWDQFDSPSAISLQNNSGKKMEGIYNFTTGSDRFGTDAALKWSYTANGSDTMYRLSFFCQKDITYIICEGKRVDSTILLNGYWRRMIGTETGKVRFTISATDGALQLLRTDSLPAGDSIVLNGVYGNGETVPDIPVTLKYARPLYTKTPFEIVSHHGGQNADLLPVSENSLEAIKLAAGFGSTGIEIDIRMTSDGVPVLFHDPTLNERLIQKNGLVGPIENYSFAQLSTLVRLLDGERIPSLDEALASVLYSTPLRYVWLDMKVPGPMAKVRELQAKYLQLAAAMGRDLTITIGIPDQGVLDKFKTLPDYTSVPSVNEMTTADVQSVNSSIWGPRFTLGLQDAEVATMHAQGRRVFVWTIDIEENIKEFLVNGDFDGMISSYPTAVAYYYYAQQ